MNSKTEPPAAPTATVETHKPTPQNKSVPFVEWITRPLPTGGEKDRDETIPIPITLSRQMWMTYAEGAIFLNQPLEKVLSDILGVYFEADEWSMAAADARDPEELLPVGLYGPQRSVFEDNRVAEASPQAATA